MALAACVPATPTPTPEIKGTGGEFRVVPAGEPATLNPNLRADDNAFAIAQNVYNKLVTLDADYRIIPDLATSWQVADDGLTYTFHLVKNVKWHDGQPLTAADVKWTLEAIAQQKGFAQELAQRIAAIDTPDATTVIVRLKAVWSPFLGTLAWYGTFILPRHLYAGGDWNVAPANLQPVGTGPFKFVEWVKGDHITLAANTAYFGQGPYLSRVTFRFFKEALDLNQLLAKGEVDYLLARPANDRIAELQRTPGVQTRLFAHPARYYLGFNLRRKPFDDVRVRRALNQALDRDVLVRRALAGYGAPGMGFYTPAVAWAYNPKATVPAFDTASAARLLGEAGLAPDANGVRAKWTLVVSNVAVFADLTAETARQLRAVGIELTPVLLPAAEWTKRVFQDRDFDIALTNGSHGPDPENLNTRLGSNSSYQFMGYVSAEFDAVMAEGASKTKLDERAQAYFRAQEILARDLPIAPLAEFVQFIPYRDGITGLPQVEARGLVTFNNYALVRKK